jgi:predicted SnoaL-like aldol condensation-catalyzing enzyme
MPSKEKDIFRDPVPNRDIALAFLNQVILGRISEAFEKYVVRQGFTHHNPYFRGDRESLKQAMMEAHQKFRNTKLEVQHVFEADDLVAIHSRVKHSPQEPEIAVVHIFRCAGQKVVELWDIGMQVPKDSPNENGAF